MTTLAGFERAELGRGLYCLLEHGRALLLSLQKTAHALAEIFMGQETSGFAAHVESQPALLSHLFEDGRRVSVGSAKADLFIVML